MNQTPFQVQSGGIKFKVRQPSTAPEAPKSEQDAPKPAVVTTTTATATADAPKKSRFKIKAPEGTEPEKPIESLSRKELLEKFYKERNTNPEKYTNGPDGNLVILDATGTPTKTIPMMTFRHLNADEVLELSRERMDDVRRFEVGSKRDTTTTEEKKEEEKEKEEEPKGTLSYVDALANLRTVYTKYKRGDPGFTARSVKDANKMVRDAERLRNEALYPIRFIEEIPNPKIKKIILDSKDDRRIGNPVYIPGHYPFKKEDTYGHYISPEEEAELARKAATKGGAAIDVILIESYDDPVRGFLHPAYTKDFAYTSTQYSSVYQAYEVERLKMLRNQTLVDQLMKTRSPKTIASIASQDRTAIPNSYDLWFSILKAFYLQNANLSTELLETGSAIFSLRDTTIPSPSDYLNALMSVRAFVAEKQEGSAAKPIEDHVITEEEQKKARVAAIINARRNT
jgi:hypothetical protein